MPAFQPKVKASELEVKHIGKTIELTQTKKRHNVSDGEDGYEAGTETYHESHHIFVGVLKGWEDVTIHSPEGTTEKRIIFLGDMPSVPVTSEDEVVVHTFG